MKRSFMSVSGALLFVLILNTAPSPAVADPASVGKFSDFGWLVYDGEGNLVVAVNTTATLVDTVSQIGVVTLEVQWQLPEGAPPPASAQITKYDGGIYCIDAAPYWREIVTPSGRGTTICTSLEP